MAYSRPRSLLVGRMDELSTFDRILQSTKQHANDTSRCLLIEGEAGIGKTRLAEEFQYTAEQRGWTVLWIRVYKQEQECAYHPWVQVLRLLLSRKLWQFTVKRKTSPLFRPLLSLVPELHDFSHGFAASFPVRQLQLWEAVLAVLTESLKSTPLLLILDDLQWIDESSIELFGFLARHLPDRLLIVGTYRGYDLVHPASTALHTLVGHLQRERHATVLHLQPLTDEHIQDLLASLPHMTHTLIRHIQGQAAGNPFFAKEFAQSRSLTSVTTIEAALDARMLTLSLNCRKVLQDASVIGGSFSFPLLSQMANNTSSSRDEEVLFALIEEALHAQILREDDDNARVLSYRFSHPLFATHFYKSLSAARRVRTHRRLAALLLTMHQGREYEVSEVLTHHLVAGGGDASDILHSSEMAAGRAYNLSAYAQAERYFRIAIEHIHLVDSHDEAGRDVHLAFLLERLGECTRVQGNDEEARSLYHSALALHQHPLDETNHAENAQIQGLLWCEIGQTWYNTGQYDEARRSYLQAEHSLSTYGIITGSIYARIRFEQCYLLWAEGHYEAADAAGQEALAVFQQGIPLRQEPLLPLERLLSTRNTLLADPVDVGRTFVILGLVANSWGRPSQAVEHWKAALVLFEQFHCVREIANVSCDLGDVYLKEAKYPDAQTILTGALALAERVNDIPLMSVIHGNLGNLTARIGTLSDAEDSLRQALAFAEQSNELVYQSIMYTYLTPVFQDQGMIADARTSIARALHLSRTLQNGPCLAHALVTLASLHLFIVKDREHKTKYVLEHIEHLIQHAQQLEGVEGETKVVGFLLLAEVALELDTKNVWEYLHHALDLVQSSSLHWLLPRTYALYALVFAVQDQQEQADSYFAKASELFLQHGLKRDYAHALSQYGQVLLHHFKETDRRSLRGRDYLREAERLYQQAEAFWELRKVERLLTNRFPSSPGA